MKPKKAPITFAEFYPRYMKWAKVEKLNKQSQLESKQSIFRRSLLPFFGEMLLDDIDEETIIDYKEVLLDQGLAPKTRNNCLTVLRSFFKAARLYRHVKYQPFIDPVVIDKDRNKTKKTPRIPEEDLPRVLEDIRKINPWVADACELMVETGLRAGEVRALKWDKVSLPPSAAGFGEILVDETTAGHKYALGTTKGASRCIPLSATALRLIQRLDRVNQFLFPNSREPSLPCSLGIIADTLRKLGKQRHLGYRVHAHLFRHTYASRLRDAGVAMGDIQLLLGHVDVRTTDRYAHRNLQKLHDAIALLDASKTNSTTKTTT